MNSIDEDEQFMNISETIHYLAENNEELKILKEWNCNQYTPKTIIPEFFKFLEEKGITKEVVEAFLAYDIKNTPRQSIFREDNPGILLFAEIWLKKESLTFMKNILMPLIEEVLKFEHTLEIDINKAEKGTDVKQNLKDLLSLVSFFLEKLYSTKNLFSETFVSILKDMHAEVSKKFTDTGVSVIGGLLFFRLICPMIISPKKYLSLEKDIPPYSIRTLINLAKVIQKMATGSMHDMKCTNIFVKKHIPEWSSFFHKLVTGNEWITTKTEVAEITAEDLAALSNQNLTKDIKRKNVQLIEKQKELINRLLALEKQSENWKMCESTSTMKIWYKKFDAGTCLARASGEVNTSLQELFYFIRDKVGEPSFDPMVIENKEIERFSENLFVFYRSLRVPIINNRDLLCLQYSDIISEDQFAIIAIGSIERDDVKDMKGFVRAHAFGGYILRGTKNDKCQLTYIFHVDGKGNLKNVPVYVKKTAALKQAKLVHNIVKYFRKKKTA